MPQIYDMGPTALLPLRRRAEDFFALKNPTASAGLEPANLGTKGQHATPRPPKVISRKNSNDSTGNRKRDLPAFRAVPQPTASPHGSCAMGIFSGGKEVGVSLTNHCHLAPWFQLRRATPLPPSAPSWPLAGKKVHYTK